MPNTAVSQLINSYSNIHRKDSLQRTTLFTVQEMCTCTYHLFKKNVYTKKNRYFFHKDLLNIRGLGQIQYFKGDAIWFFCSFIECYINDHSLAIDC